MRNLLCYGSAYGLGNGLGKRRRIAASKRKTKPSRVKGVRIRLVLSGKLQDLNDSRLRELTNFHFSLTNCPTRKISCSRNCQVDKIKSNYLISSPESVYVESLLNMCHNLQTTKEH